MYIVFVFRYCCWISSLFWTSWSFPQCAKSQGMLSWMVNFRFAEGLHWNICRGLQGLHWNTEKRDLLQFLFCPQVQFDFECERTLRTGANMNWIFCSCIKKIKKENVTAAENLKIRPLVFSSQRTNFKSTDENMSPSLSSNIKASKSLFRYLPRDWEKFHKYLKTGRICRRC